VGQFAELFPRGLKPEFILGHLMYGLKPVPFKLKPVPFKLIHYSRAVRGDFFLREKSLECVLSVYNNSER
jgi:hypothetical protein